MEVRNPLHLTSLINYILDNFSIQYKISLKIEFNDSFCPFIEKPLNSKTFRPNFTSLKENNLNLTIMKTKIGITEQNTRAVADQLAKLLADETLLYIKTRNAHWNVTGDNFHANHIFFEEQYKQLDELIDSVAERMRKIGHYAPATMKMYLELTHLTEYSDRTNDGLGYMKDLLADHENIIEFLRGNITPFAEEFKDFGTSDFITGLMETHEEMAWMIRSYFR
ncbi:starvation-inducible DNA-binding protein [Chryseobacterium nakagawai]|nr:starvation-inducible DNA-binding protein [Chryseobacterium nakagawai]